MRERLCRREKSFFKHTLTWFLPFFSLCFWVGQLLSKTNNLPSAADYISFRKRSGNSSLIANPTINTWTETHVLQGAGLHQASLLQPYKTFSLESHARFVPCCHQWCPDPLQLLLLVPDLKAPVLFPGGLLHCGCSREEQEWDGFVKRWQFIFMNITTQSLDFRPLKKRHWKLDMFLFPFKISTMKSHLVGRQVPTAFPAKRC